MREIAFIVVLNRKNLGREYLGVPLFLTRGAQKGDAIVPWSFLRERYRKHGEDC